MFAQFSGSLRPAAAAYRIGTTSAVELNLEDCSGCGIQGWGWQDDGWGVGILGPTILFQTTGTQTLRIQTREDGFSIDRSCYRRMRFLFVAGFPEERQHDSSKHAGWRHHRLNTDSHADSDAHADTNANTNATPNQHLKSASLQLRLRETALSL